MNIDNYKLLHANNPQYGSTGLTYMPEVSLLLDILKPATVLDFGCGKATLISELTEARPGIAFYGYDPAIPGRDTLPTDKIDLVICTDVLEHIPEHELENVVRKIASLSQSVFFYCHHGLAVEILPDGTNAHCTVKPPFWYWRLFEKYFSHITTLHGRTLNTSVVLTIKLPPQFFTQYEKILGENHMQNYAAALERRIAELENITGRIWRYLRPFRGIIRILRGDFGPVKTVLTGLKNRIKRNQG